jgi:hypothetical protein
MGVDGGRISVPGASAGTGRGGRTGLGGRRARLGRSPIRLWCPAPRAKLNSLKNAQEAKLANPEEAKLREESRTKFENLNPEQAAKADGEAYPAVIDEPDGGPPRLPAGQSITGYVNANVTLSASGDTLVVSVDRGSGSY